MKLRFGAFELDREAGELRRSGILVRLQPQPFKVLAHLASRAGALVTREELRALLWGEGTHVEFERGLNFALSRVRDALSDRARAPLFIETVPRRGYRFVAPVTVLDPPARALPVDPASPLPAPPPAPFPNRIGRGAVRPLAGAAAVLSFFALLAVLAGARPAARNPSADGDGATPRGAAARAAYENARALCGAEGWRRSIALYAEALRLDAGFAEAHAGMARSYIKLGEHAHLDAHLAFPAARHASSAALALADGAEARFLRGSVLLDYDWDWAGAERDLTRAVALAPGSAEAWARLARFRSAAGDDAGAVAAARRAEALDPADAAVTEALAACLWRARRLEESALAWRRLTEGNGIASHHALFSILRRAGKGAEALDEARLVMEAVNVPADRIDAVMRLGPEAGARAYLRGTIAALAQAAGRAAAPPDRFALLHAALGENDRALSRLEEALSVRSPSLLGTLRDPDLDALRGEPRFRRILDTVGRRPSREAVSQIALAASPRER